MSSTTVLGFIKDIACCNLKAVQERLRATPAQGPNQTFADPKEQGLSYRLLHKAVEVCSPDIAAALLAAGADVNAQDSRGRTPLHWAARSTAAGALTTAELLLRQPGINIQAASSSNATPLHEAAAAGNVPLLQLLLKHGAQPQDTTPGFTALHAACMGCCTKPPAAATPAQPVLACSQQAVLQDNSPQQQQQLQDTSAAATAAHTEPQQQAQAAPASKPGQLKAAAVGRPHPPQQLCPKPPATAAPARKAGPAAPQRPTVAARPSPGLGRTPVTTSRVAGSAGRPTPAAAAGAQKAAASAAAAAAAAPAAAAQPPAGKQQGGALPCISRELVDVLLGADPDLLKQQDWEGFTPLMRLVQRGLTPEAEMLLARGDCGINAHITSTGDTALHLACSSAYPGLRLVSALLTAGADPTLPRGSDGNTPLLLAARAGGQPGLALAKVLLEGRSSLAAQQQHWQQQQKGMEEPGIQWCPLDKDGQGQDSGSRQAGGLDAANAAGETAVGVVATAVLASLGVADSASGSSAGKAAAVAAEAERAVAQQELLALLLVQQAVLSQGVAGALLQQGLAGRLSDDLTAKVVGSMPDMPTLNAAAAAAAAAATAAGSSLRLDFSALLEAQMYRTAIALLCKSSSRRACDIMDADSNTLLHTAVSGSGDQPGYVSALVEAGVGVNAANKDNDTALHIAARQGHVEACRALVAAGADLLRRNGRNRIPGSQLKLCEPVRCYLQQAEEAFRAAKEEQRHALWDDTMKATQTQSAFGIRVT